jgi:RNA polymerase sigma-54 factor
MSGMRLGMDMHVRQSQNMILAPRMIQSMEILQLPIADLQAKIEKELQENPSWSRRRSTGTRTTLSRSSTPPARPSSTTRPATSSSTGWTS